MCFFANLFKTAPLFSEALLGNCVENKIKKTVVERFKIRLFCMRFDF